MISLTVRLGCLWLDTTYLPSKMPYPFKHFSEYLAQVNLPGSLFFNSVSSSEIELEIMPMP